MVKKPQSKPYFLISAQMGRFLAYDQSFDWLRERVAEHEKLMQIEKLHTPEEIVAECAVIIDVLRAFTTAASVPVNGDIHQ